MNYHQLMFSPPSSQSPSFTITHLKQTHTQPLCFTLKPLISNARGVALPIIMHPFSLGTLLVIITPVRSTLLATHNCISIISPIPTVPSYPTLLAHPTQIHPKRSRKRLETKHFMFMSYLQYVLYSTYCTKNTVQKIPPYAQ